MKTLIVYAGSNGCAEKVAEKMKENLGENVVVVNLKKESDPSINGFERIVIGGSIHAGQIQEQIKTFCGKNLDDLLTKEVGLFICCIKEGEANEKQLINTFPEELYHSAKTTAIFKSGYDYSRMNFLEKMIAMKINRVRHNISKVDYEAVQKFSRRMDRVFNPFLFLA